MIARWMMCGCAHAAPPGGGRPAGSRRVIDTHAHRYPEEWIRAVEKTRAAHGARIVRNDDCIVFVLGSDCRFDTGYERPVEVVERLATLASEERNAILGANAARLLRLAD